MKRLLPALLVACVLGAAKQACAIVWLRDYALAARVAKQQKKPIMAFLHIPNTFATTFLEKQTFPGPAVERLARSFVAVKIDGDRSPKAKALNPRNLPAVYFLSATGEVLCRVLGGLEPDSFAIEMQRALANDRDWPRIQQARRAGSPSPAVSARYASLLANRGSLAEAITALKTPERSNYKGAEMAVAYNAIGDEYQLGVRMDEAITYFKKADKIAAKPADRAYALVSIISCYLAKRDRNAALPYARRLAGYRGAPATYIRFAKNVLRPTPRGSIREAPSASTFARRIAALRA